MSPLTTSERRISMLKQAPLIVLQVVLWILLWGSFSVMTVVTGIVLALLITRLFYLPPAELSGRIGILSFLFFFCILTIDIITASLRVAWQALNWRYHPTNAIIGIELHTRSDLIMTFTAEAISLVPGSVVVEVDRERQKLYLHTLGTPDEESLEKVRRSVLATERRITRAFGSRADILRLRRERQQRQSDKKGNRS